MKNIIALRTATTVRIIPFYDYFLVLHGDHGWAHSEAWAAFEDAQWLANNTGKRISNFAKEKQQ